MKNIVKTLIVFALLLCFAVTFMACRDDEEVYVDADSSETTDDSGSESEENSDDSDGISIGQGDDDDDQWGELIYVG